LHTRYFSSTRIQGTLSAVGIDGRLRTASISPVQEQPPHYQWLPPQLLQHENSLLQIFPVPDPDLARSATRRTRFQPCGHVPCAAPAALWYSKISVGEREQELEEQWGEKRKVTWMRYATWQPWWQSNNLVSCQVGRRVVTVTEIFVFKRFQSILFELFEFNLEMTLCD
jgi:hypothetical protein